MKHKPLVFSARFFHGVHALSCAPLALSVVAGVVSLPVALVTGFWWAPAGALALAGASVIAWALGDVLGSASAFLLHNRIGTRASVSSAGLGLEGELLRFPRLAEWHEVALVRRVFARQFPIYEVRFRTEPAYELTLRSGELIFMDFVDETSLRAECQARGIAAEGFESRLPAELGEHEPG